MPKIKVKVLNDVNVLQEMDILDDLWVLVANFLELPDLAKLKRVSKELLAAVNKLMNLIERNPQKLDRLIAEIDVMAVKKFRSLVGLIGGKETHQEYVRELESAIHMPLIPIFSGETAGVISQLNANRQSGVLQIGQYYNKGKIALILGGIFSFLFLGELIAQTATRSSSRLNATSQNLFFGGAILLAVLTVTFWAIGLYFCIRQKREITTVIENSQVTSSSQEENAIANPLHQLDQELKKKINEIAKNAEGLTNERFRLFGKKEQLQPQKRVVDAEEFSELFDEMVKLILTLHNKEEFMEMLPEDCVEMIGRYFDLLLENEKSLSEDMQKTLNEFLLKRAAEKDDYNEASQEKTEEESEEVSNGKSEEESDQECEEESDEEAPLLNKRA